MISFHTRPWANSRKVRFSESRPEPFLYGTPPPGTLESSRMKWWSRSLVPMMGFGRRKPGVPEQWDCPSVIKVGWCFVCEFHKICEIRLEKMRGLWLSHWQRSSSGRKRVVFSVLNIRFPLWCAAVAMRGQVADGSGMPVPAAETGPESTQASRTKIYLARSLSAWKRPPWRLAATPLARPDAGRRIKPKGIRFCEGLRR